MLGKIGYIDHREGHHVLVIMTIAYMPLLLNYLNLKCNFRLLVQNEII